MIDFVCDGCGRQLRVSDEIRRRIGSLPILSYRKQDSCCPSAQIKDGDLGSNSRVGCDGSREVACHSVSSCKGGSLEGDN